MFLVCINGPVIDKILAREEDDATRVVSEDAKRAPWPAAERRIAAGGIMLDAQEVQL